MSSLRWLIFRHNLRIDRILFDVDNDMQVESANSNHLALDKSQFEISLYLTTKSII